MTKREGRNDIGQTHRGLPLQSVPTGVGIPAMVKPLAPSPRVLSLPKPRLRQAGRRGGEEVIGENKYGKGDKLVKEDSNDSLSDMNATQISEYSHNDVPWLTTDKGEIIDYESVFYRTKEYSMRYKSKEG
jgi:hypothetical protein